MQDAVGFGGFGRRPFSMHVYFGQTTASILQWKSEKTRSQLVVACVTLPFMLLAVCLRSACAKSSGHIFGDALCLHQLTGSIWTGSKLKAAARVANTAAARVTLYHMTYLTPIPLITDGP
jgi:hypothetical protein